MGTIQFKGGTIQFKGGTIQFKNPGKIANPTISARWGSSASVGYHQVNVTNNDTETVEVWASTASAPGTLTLRGSLAGGASEYYSISQMALEPPEGATFTAYVQLRATGRTNSDTVSDVSGGYIPIHEGGF